MSEKKRIAIMLGGKEIAVIGESITDEQRANYETASEGLASQTKPESELDPFKKVSKYEFDFFIEKYPTKLKYDVTGICEPPLASYNDFSEGKVWPESMVAKIVLNEARPSYEGQENDYYILDK